MSKNSLFKNTYIILSILLIYFIFLPVLSVFLYSIFTGNEAGLNIEEIKESLVYLLNSIKVSSVVTIIATLLGFILAFTINRIKFHLNKIYKLLVLLPLFNPPFCNSVVFIMLFGKRGLISNKLLGLSHSPFGFWGIVAMQSIGLMTFSYILISSAIKKVDVDVEESAKNLGASGFKVFFTITLPLMIPEITSAALLVFLASISDFGTPVIIGGAYRTLSADLYIQITGLYNMKMASISGILLLIPCIAAFVLQKYVLGKRLFSSKNADYKDIEFKMGILPKTILITITTIIVLFVASQYIFIVAGTFTKQWGYDFTFTLNNFKEAFKYGFKSFFNSIKLAITVSFISSIIGIYLSYLVNRFDFKISRIVDFIAVLPAAVPGILFGIGYLITFARKPLILIGTKIIVYIICIARSLNVGFKSGSALLSHLDPDIEYAAYNLGSNEFNTFKDISIPLLKPAFFTAVLKTVTTNMVTLGAIIFLLLPSNKVAVQMIFQVLTSSNIGVASSLSVLFSFISMFIVLIIYLLFNMKDVIGGIKEWILK